MAVDRIVPITAVDLIRSVESGNGVVSIAAVDKSVTAAATDDRVVAVSAIDGRVPVAASNRVVPAVSVDDFGAAAAANEDVISLGPDPARHVFDKIVGDEIIQVDVLEKNRKIRSQVNMGVCANLYRRGN